MLLSDSSLGGHFNYRIEILTFISGLVAKDPH